MVTLFVFHPQLRGMKMNKTGTIYGRLTRETLEALIADSQSKETKEWLLGLLRTVPDKLGYSISDPMCIRGVRYGYRAYDSGNCSGCIYYKASKFPPGTGECRWSDWQKMFRGSTPKVNKNE